MPWQRPTLNELYTRIARDFSARLLDGGPLAARSVVAVLARVWAGCAHALHGMLAWLFNQVFIDTCEAEYLEKWAADWGLARKGADYATGFAAISGAPGAVLPAGVLWLDQASQEKFAALADCTIDADGNGQLSLRALAPGVSGNLPSGAVLTLIAPVAGIEAQGRVAAPGFSGGVDEEADAELRGRLLERLRRPPRGGSAADYERWAKEVPGITRAWCYPLMEGIGTVGLCVVADNAPDGPLPSEELLARVRAHIEPLRPATVKEFTVFAPEPMPVDIKLQIKPDSAALRLAVQAELGDLFAREGQPGSTLYRSHISEAISLTASEVDHTLIEPAENIEVPAGVLPLLGNVQFLEAE